MPDTLIAVRRVRVEGAVQGVGYREFTRRAALRLGVSGWVRNRSDGAVEAMLRGSLAAVEALIAEMCQGPGVALVDALSVVDPDEQGEDGGGAFVIRPTR